MQCASVFTDQSPDDLYLSLVEGPLDAHPYTVLWEQPLRMANIDVTARVIGASHIITFTANETTFHEMLACAAPPDGVDLYRLSLKTPPTHRVERCLGRLRYTFESHRIEWGDGEPFLLDTLVAQASSFKKGEFGVVYPFPQGALPAVPKTVLWGSVSGNGACIQVKTAHSYPGQAVVFSDSCIFFE